MQETGSLDTEPSPADERDWRLTNWGAAFARPMGLLSALFGLSVIAGYWWEAEPLYRPVSGGPATNPLTALAIMFAGLALFAGSGRFAPWLQRACGAAVASLSLIVLADFFLGTGFAGWITPFQDAVQTQREQGLNNAFGANSAVLLACIALSVLFQTWRMPLLSQIVASIALAVPFVSFTGYAYDIPDFFGQMSIITASIGTVQAASALGLTADHGVLKGVLSPHIGGRIARVQIFLGGFFPFLLGYLVVDTLVSRGAGNMFGVFVVSVGWFIIVLVSVSALFQERADQKRRAAERALEFTAFNDPLTRLPNRRKFYDAGYRDFERSRRLDAELWAAMIDIDHFKSVNDTGGHAMGDRILARVGKVILGSVRAADAPGRIGGEEFAILLADTRESGMRRVAEAVRSGVEAMDVEDWTERHGPVTVSIGCACSRGRNSLEALLAAADEALYAAKAQGRNRVVINAPGPARAGMSVSATG